MLSFMEIQKLEKEQFSKKGHKFGFNMLNLRCHWDISSDVRKAVEYMGLGCRGQRINV